MSPGAGAVANDVSFEQRYAHLIDQNKRWYNNRRCVHFLVVLAEAEFLIVIIDFYFSIRGLSSCTYDIMPMMLLRSGSNPRPFLVLLRRLQMASTVV